MRKGRLIVLLAVVLLFQNIYVMYSEQPIEVVRISRFVDFIISLIACLMPAAWLEGRSRKAQDE